jgi:hypothetical protein
VISSLPLGSPDMFNGTAGRLRFHLLLWDETNEGEHLRHAVEAGEFLLESAEETGDGGRAVLWTIPSSYGAPSGPAQLGYAHGAAGIADALLDLFEATEDDRFLSAAQNAGRWLARQAVPVLDDSGLGWPRIEGKPPVGAAWCHGATGKGCFFLHAAGLDAAGIAARGPDGRPRGALAGPHPVSRPGQQHRVPTRFVRGDRRSSLPRRGEVVGAFVGGVLEREGRTTRVAVRWA